MGGILLSAALIVRDEENFLEGCLRSLKDRVDEIVVVDTGSTDRSRDIAAGFGARLVSHAWTGDFAAARNASLDAARGAWILYIDADERVVEFDRAALEKQLAAADHVCYTVLFRPAVGYTRYREFRLFRKRPDLRFRGMIHETLVPALQELKAQKGLRIGESSIAIDHFGYEGDLRHKHVRNLPLLRARLEREPDHVYCLDQLGLALQGTGDDAGAEDAFRRAIAIARESHSADLVDSLPFLHLANLLLDAKRDASALVAEGCRRFPQNHSLTWLCARQLVERGQYADAMPLFARLAAIDATRLGPAMLAFDASIFGAQSHAALGLCALRLERFDESAAHYARAQALAPDDIEIRAKHAVAALRARKTGTDHVFPEIGDRPPRSASPEPPPALLFVVPLLPAESGNGLAMRAGMFLDALAHDFTVTLLVVPVAGGPVDGALASRFVQRRTHRVATVPLEGALDPLWDLSARILDDEARTSALSAYPRPALCRHATTPWLNSARAALAGARFDAVHVMRSYLAPYAAPFLDGGMNSPVPFASIDLDDDEPLTHRRLAMLYRQGGRDDDARLAEAEAAKYERHEATWLPRFQLRIAGTQEHARRIAAAYGEDRAATVPNTIAVPRRRLPDVGKALRALTTAPRHALRNRPRNRILFVGNLSYFPNTEGIRHFVLETLPRLQRRFNGIIELRIAGSAPTPEVTALARSPGVELIADPPTLAPHYRWADLCVIPIAAGGGTRIKLLEAFAHGVPVVSTHLGAEGIAAGHRIHLLLAERNDAFADSCAELLGDRELAARLAGNAQKLVQTHYAREAGVRIIREIFAAQGERAAHR